MQKSIWVPPHSWCEQVNGQMLYRGFSRRVEGRVLTIASPELRQPRNMPVDVQTSIDNWFERKFGIRFRQRSLFATGSLEIAESYASERGEVRSLEPQADFCFCWSEECVDLYSEYQQSYSGESIDQLMERLDFRCDNLDYALRTGNEIMFVCRQVAATRLTTP